jgi:predicted HTH domain antitoxin
MKKEEREKRLAEMCRLYEEEKWSCDQIGKHFDLTRQAVQSALKKSGLKMRSGKRARRHLDRKSLVQIYEKEKRTISETSRILKTSNYNLKEELLKNNIPLRSRGYTKIRFPQMLEMKVGDVIKVNQTGVKYPNRDLHSKAFRIGIRVSVKKIKDNNFQITRIE